MAIIGVSNGIILEVPDKGQTEWADIMTLVFQIISAHNHDGNGHGAKLGSASLDDLSITTAKIVNLAVTTAKLADLSVSTAKLADLAVTSGKLADDSVTTAKVLNANITSAKLATDAALDNISSGSILADKLATDSVTTTKIVDANVTTAKLANVAVTDAQLAALSALKLTPLSADPGSPVTGQLQYADGTARTAGLWAWNGSTWVSFSGAVTDDSVYTNAIQDNAVTTAKMADRAVSARTLAVDANFPSSQYSLSLRQNITYISPATTVTIGFTPNRVRFINDRFIAVGEFGNAAHSIDGVTWTAITTGTTVGLRDVTYSKKYFSYYICGTGGVIIYSNDLSTWTAATGTGAIEYSYFIHDLEDQIVALPASVGTGQSVAISTDFSNFTVTSMTGTLLFGVQIFYDTVTKVAYAITSTAGNTTFRTSTNFIAWTSVSLGNFSNLQISTAVINGRVILPEKNSGDTVRLITSPNGTAKNVITSEITATNNFARGVGLYQGKLIFAYTDDSGTLAIQVFENGSWVSISLPSNMNSFNSVMFFDDLIIACGTNSPGDETTFISDNKGVTWSDFSGQLFSGNGKSLVAYNNNGRIVSGFGNQLLVCGVVQTIEKNPILSNRQGA